MVRLLLLITHLESGGTSCWTFLGCAAVCAQALIIKEISSFTPGVHDVHVLYDNMVIVHSPFKVTVSDGCDPGRVVATGAGLQQARANQPNPFQIITRYRGVSVCLRACACVHARASLCPSLPRGAGVDNLGITVEGPSESKMSCKDNKDGSCSVEYIPFTSGLYSVNILYGGEHIPGESVPSRLRHTSRLCFHEGGGGCAHSQNE